MVNIYIELMVGLLGVILGFITMKYKLGYLVSGVNIKKYDNDKVANIKKYDNDKVASIAGSHVMLYGLILIFLSGVNYILLDSNATNIINITMLMSTFAIVIGIYYKINKYAKVDISND